MRRTYKRKGAGLLGALLSIGLLLALAPQKAQAQVLYGSIVGHVTDPSGAAVPGAKVTISSKETGQSREDVTDQTGDFSFPDVQSGTYRVRVTQQGFKASERTTVPVTINAVTRVDVTLEVGAVTQAVTVTGEAPVLQTETPEVHADVGAPELENLPVPLGRNYQQLYRALPGFTPPVNSHSIPTNPARSLEFNVNGTSDNQNNTRIDGVSTYNVQLPHVTSYVPTLESIQEVNVVTDSFDAEQGFAGGAAINVQTKSGSNQFHGSLFEYNSNNHLKAWPMQFDAAGSRNVGNKPKLVYNQFGGAVGGPIKKNKLFFFTSYEGTYDHRAVQRFTTVPTAAMRTGDLSRALGKYDCFLNGSVETSSSAGCPADGSTPIMVTTTEGATVQSRDGMVFDPTTGNPVTAVGREVFSNLGALNVIPPSRLDSIAQSILSLVPLPNRGGVKRDYFVSGPFGFNRNQIDTKINFNATSKLNFIGTLGILHYTDTVPTIFGTAAVGRPIGGSSNPGHGHGETYRTTIMGTYAFSPNFLMDAHFGYAKQGTNSEQPDLGKNIGSDVLGIPGTNGTRRFESGWPEFDFNCVGCDGDFNTIGINSNFMPYFRHDPQYQYEANFNWVKGTHNIRFGTDLYRMALNQTQAEFISGSYGAQGGFDFNRAVTDTCLPVPGAVNPDNSCNFVSADTRSNSIGSFLLGLSDFRATTLQVPDVYHIHAWLTSAYFRDRWNITPKLTLDYGTRWEYYPVPKRPDRGIERYDPNTNNVLLCGVGSIPSDCGTQVSKKLFAPRLGFAYRAADTFVFRAGYGITIDPYEAMELLRANYPLLIALNQSNVLGGFFPVGSLKQGIPPINVPSFGNGTIPLPVDVGFQGLPKKLERGYVQSWNFTVQRQLKWGFTGQVGYVATRSTRQLGFLNLNAGQMVGGGQAGEPLFAKYGRTATTVILTPVATGHYDSLQASLNRRFTQGLSLIVNYTWGKAINNVDNSDGGPGDEKIQVFRYNFLNRSVTDFDRTHNLEIMNIWQLPFGRGKRWLSDRGALSHVVSGWQVNSLTSLISGPPFTVYASGSAFNTPGSNQTADRVKLQVTKVGSVDPNLPFLDPTAFADVNSARFGTAGFNIVRGPGIVNLDFGVFREFSINERWKLQFRAEAFNFTNTPHFDVPDNCVCDGVPGPPGSANFGNSFMTVTSTTNLAREGIDERQFRVGLRLNF